MKIDFSEFEAMQKGLSTGVPVKRKYGYPTLTFDGKQGRFNVAAAERMPAARYLTLAKHDNQILLTLYNHNPRNKESYTITRRSSSYTFSAMTLANYLAQTYDIDFSERNYAYEAEFVDPRHILIEADEWISAELKKGVYHKENSNRDRIAQFK